MNDDIAIVLVTYNRVELLEQCIQSIKRQTHKVQKLIVINNASTDGTSSFLGTLSDENIVVINNSVNNGGAGGFSQGLKLAYDQGYTWTLLIDDDVLLNEHCIEYLMRAKKPAMIAVRENKQGNLVEMAALKFDLKSLFILRPKRMSVSNRYQTRDSLPETIEVENVSFEGFMVHRDIVSEVGFPDERYFIFYDDVDYALRIRNLGHKIYAIRDSIIVRQLEYNPSKIDSSWKSYYIYRNFFHIHHRYGQGFLVKKRVLFLCLILLLINLSRLRFSFCRSLLFAYRHHKNLNLPPRNIFKSN